MHEGHTRGRNTTMKLSLYLKELYEIKKEIEKRLDQAERDMMIVNVLIKRAKERTGHAP